jgi:serine/threonine protein kinase
VLIDHVIGGKYRITELIGQGGMGTVFEAVHSGTGARVAIKLIVSSDIKEEVFVRFQREARAAGAIDSHHIVRIFDMGTDDRSGSPYMVMERLVGEDLSQLMRRVGPIAPEHALAIIGQAALGLSKAHEAGVVHRDIKPANVFLHDGGDSGEVVVKILDFGIAKVMTELMQRAEEGGLTRTGSMLGSPHYMSPEQAQGLRTIDHRTDVWSLGVVLYKMLTGQTPHAHLQTLGQVILAICSSPARPVQELAPWVPPEVAAIVHRAIQPDPGQRYQTAFEMWREIDALVGSMPKLRRGDIMSLSPEQRARIAPPLTVYPRHDAHTNGSSTQHGMVQTPVPARKSSGFVIAMAGAGMLAAIGLAGIGVAVMAKKSAAARQAAATTASVVVVATPPPSTEPATSTEPPAAPVEQTVSVVVLPATATVEVDGKPAQLVDGKLELKGPLGTIHDVKVVDHDNETKQVVAITEGGAIPPKIVLAPPPPTSSSSSSAKLGSKVWTPGPPTPKPPEPTGTGVNVQRKFE